MTLPASLESLGNGVFDNCAGLTSVTVADGNTKFSAQDGVLYDSSKTELLLYPAAKPDEAFAIPNSVTHIDSYAFKGARYLQTVTASNLTSIGNSAFINCEALTSFAAASLDEVKSQAFYECASLETFQLTDETSLKTIGGNAFARCSSLTGAPLAGAASIEDNAFQDCTALTSLTFCETGSVSIGNSAFSGCIGLTELTFPESVTSIGSNAFGGCNKVTVITFKSATPPSCGYDIFSIGDPTDFQIIVPTGSEDSYRNVLGETLGSYVGNTLVKKYPLFVNGQQLTSENTTIICGSGTASFDVTTSTLTLTNATINTMGGDYGGAINSGLAELTIKLVGTNTIHAEQQDYWGTTYRDSINSGTNCDVKIVSGTTDGTTPTLVCDLIDMGRGDSGFTGGAGEGNLTVDGVNLTVNDRIFVHHNTTFQNGAQVNVTGGLTVNNSATVKVEGDDTAVTVKYIALGNSLPGQTNQLVLESGTLTISGSVAFPGATDGDTNPYAIHFDPVSSGSIAINGGMFEKQASCAGTNIDESKITQAGNLPVQGSWESGTLIIGPASDGKYTVTVKSDPAEGGVAYGGGRYAENETATLTVTAQTGWVFIGWYQDSGDAAVNVSKSYVYTVGEADVTFTAKFIEDKLYQAEQAKGVFGEAQQNDKLTWTVLTDAVEAYNAVPAFLTQVKGIDGLLADDDKTALDTRYENLTTYYQSITALDLSNQGIDNDDLAELYLFTGVTDLNLSGNKGIADLSALNGLLTLGTLDISDTGVTTLESLIEEGESSFPGYQNLTAHNLTLTSLSALAGTVNVEGFSAEAITKWDFTGSTLPDTEDSKTDVEAIQSKLGDKFIPPTIKTTPTPTPGGDGGATSYGVTVADCEHGKISAEPAKAAKGDTVTVTVTPDEGYELESLAVSDAGGKAVEVSRNDDGTFSFEMPASNVTVTASFAAEPAPWESPYSDVSEADWFYADVAAVSERGVMAGYGGTDLFGPYDGTTRAMAATVIWRLAGEPEVDYAVPFADVEEGQWYTEAVRWAASTGVAAGYGGTDLFGTDDPVTREQFATMLSRFAQAAGLAPVEPGDLSAFSDAAKVSEWGAEGMAWAVGAGVVRGVDESHLAPQSGALRCELAAMLNRTIEGFDL